MSSQDTNLITASVCAHPFRMESRAVEIEPGLTVKAAMDRYVPLGVRLDAHVFVNGEPVERVQWDSYPLKSGQHVDVRVVPTGDQDGKDILRTVMSLAVMVGSFWFGGFMADPMLWGRVGGFIAGAGAMVGGQYLVNRMLPYPDRNEPAVLKQQPLYSITSQQNQANQYGAIPKIYGQMKIYPPLAALPYTEIVGDDQYMRLLYIAGYGPLGLTDFRVGDEEAANYNAEIIFCEGYADCTDCPQYAETSSGYGNQCNAGWTSGGVDGPTGNEIYSNGVYENSLNEHLEYEVGAGWIEHLSKADEDADEISVDLTFPHGLCDFDEEDGKRRSASVTIESKYKKEGAADWLPNDDPAVEDICPNFEDWSAKGGATYSADIDGSGNPGFTLDAVGEFAYSPPIRVYYPSQFDFIADFYSDDASPEYTVEAQYYQTNYGLALAGKIKNDDGETETVLTGSFAQSSWDENAEQFTGGGYVRYVRLKIKFTAQTPAAYSVRLPRIVGYKAFTFTAANPRPFRRTIRWDVAEPGRYVIQLRRADAAGGDRVLDDVYWTTLRTIVHEDPVQLDVPLAQVAMRIKASGNMSGTIDQVSCRASSYLPVYTGSWAYAETANPAWCYCDVLRGAANANAVADSRIDLVAVAIWAPGCTLRPFNGVIDQTKPLWDVLKSICAVGYASPTLKDGQYSIVVDGAGKTIKQHFTPRNSWGFSGSKSFNELPHGIKMKYFNADEDYLEDEAIYYHPEYTEATAERFQTIEMLGVTGYDQAYNLGRYHMAAMRLRPEVFTLNADVEHIVCTRGDVVAVGHDVPMWGLGYGRLTSVTPNGLAYDLGLDSEVTMVTGNNYVLRLRLSTGTTGYAPLVNANDTVTTVTTTDWVIDPTPTVGDLFMFGIMGYEQVTCLVQSIVPGADLSATLTLVEYNEAVYTVGDIPEHESNITVGPDPHRTPPVPIVYQVRSDEDVMYEVAPCVLESQILIDLVRASGSAIMPHESQVQYRGNDAGEEWKRLPNQAADSNVVSVRPVEDGVAYDVRLRYVSYYGRASAWCEVTGHTVVGKTTPPPDIETLVYQPSGRLEWVYTPPRDFRGFQVRYNEGENLVWANGTPVHDGYVYTPAFDISGFASGTTTWLVKAYDTAGNESVNAAYVVKDIGDPTTNNIIQTIDYEAGGYPGHLTDCAVDGGTGDLFADEEASLFYHGDETLFYDWGTLFYGSTYKGLSYVMSHYPYVASSIGSDLWLDYTAVQLRDVYYRLTDPEESDDFSGTLAAWTEDNDGTWAIASEILTGIHDSGGVYNQTLSFNTAVGAASSKYYIFFRVKNSDVSESRFGCSIRGQYYLWRQTKHNKTIEGDTTENPVMTDGTWAAWLFEILVDGTINWYVDGELIDSGTAQGTGTTFRFVMQQDASGTNTTSWDDFKTWEPLGNWIVWPGKIRVDTDELYEIRFRTFPGATRGKLTSLSSNLDVPDIIEYQNDVAIAATTGTRLTLVKTFTSIENVLLTVQTSGAETAITTKADDKQNQAGANNGPLIKCYDAAGAVVAGHVDVTLKGY